MIRRTASLRWVMPIVAITWGCSERPGQPAAPAAGSAQVAPSPSAPDAAAAADDAVPAPPVRSAAVLDALAPSNATGCVAGARCIKVTPNGLPQSSGTSIAQCRGEMADFIVPKNTVPAGYAGPWFQPNKIEEAHTGVPSGARPWQSIDPRVESQRLAYLLALRNYAFTSAQVRALTPTLTADTDYLDTTGGTVPAGQRGQKWYPAPRMIFGTPSVPGSGAREAAYGMTAERTTPPGTLAGNINEFRNYAVAYYDARGARTFARVWSTAAPGKDVADRSKMKFAVNSLVFKLLYSAAKASDFPTDILANSLSVKIIPNRTGGPVDVRLLQIDIAVKDERAGTTGWYFATYAYDQSRPGSSPWLKMAPVGLMWGNDPGGLPLKESWINPSAPAYAKAHLGFEGRLNGPVDNPVSACMSCHSTAQAKSLAFLIADRSCASKRASWFRNLSGTTPFGRFDRNSPTCEEDLAGEVLTAADYSLQLSDTVTHSLVGAPTVNPCTFDPAAPPASPPVADRAPMDATKKPPTVFPVTRDPEE
jgi:hypothetical protein